MSRDYELDRLKSEEQAAFQRKQSAWKNYADAKDRANAAYDEMESAWQERCRAREEMNREFEIMQNANSHHQEIWDEYGRIRDYNNSRIDSLRYEADSEHREMQMCFENASSEYSHGDKSMAPVYAEEGREHKERRDELNAEISSLIAEIKSAKERAQYLAPRTDSHAFHVAKDRFEDAKSAHQAAEREFKRRKSDRDRLKAIFDEAQAEHTRLKEAFQHRLAEVKAANQRDRSQILDKAGIYGSERKDAKIVKKSDGTTQIYHGGIGSGDGIGHGHTALDHTGRKTYDRDAFSAHGSHNYTDDKTLAIGTDKYNGSPAKVRKRNDGRTDIFFNSSGHYGDGVGHGHIVVDEDDNVRYMRDEWQDKRQGQYLIDDSKKDHTKI